MSISKGNIQKSPILKEEFARRIIGVLDIKESSHVKNILRHSDIGAIVIPKFSEIGKIINYRIKGKNLFIENIHGHAEREVREEFSRIIEQKNIQSIHFSLSLDTIKKRILSNILAKNHPLIEVLRLIPGNDIVNIGFAGIKKLNDTHGQDFVDSLMEVSKTKIMQGAEGYVRAHEHTNHIRLVRDDYKNLSISVPPGTPVGQALFGNMTSKQQFIDGVIHDMHDTIGAQAQEKGISVADIEADIRKYFNFGIGKASVGEQAQGKDKLLSFAGAEGVARDGLASFEITVHTFDKSRYEVYAKAFLQIEEGIMTQWKDVKFTIDGAEDSVVFEIGGQKILNPELLRQIRKHGATGAGIEPKALAEYIERYIDTLNKGFDFIVPARNLEKDLKTARDISQDFSQGIIRTQSLLETFKGVMTREHFMHMVGNKSGMRVFIDIKDMGIENLQSFGQLAKKVGSGTYSPDDLLTAGKEMTDKFTLFVERIRMSYPDALISLGGDEIRVFFLGVGKKESAQILVSIEKELQYTGLEGRSSHTLEAVRTAEDNEKIFKNLDESTALHKTIEAILLRKRVLLKKYKNIRETISLELGSGVNEQNLTRLLKNPEFGKLLNRIIDTVTTGNILPKDISLPGGGMLHFQREGGLLKFLFTHVI
ncbi:MAG: hypothetical protein PHQ95_01705 [Candidatus Gracilibacteria bacterium]|nr:hypothetical protein [Candidatus Gracilibacteria bacterium]